MASRVPGFQPERLSQALAARGATKVAVAEAIGVTGASLSNYTSGRQSPKPETVEKLAGYLQVPRSFFSKPVTDFDTGVFHYRSLAAATKSARRRAESRFVWVAEITRYLRKFLEIPAPNLPQLALPPFEELSSNDIELAAIKCRNEWGLDELPITNVTRTLELNGVVVCRDMMHHDALDAFSVVVDGVPFVSVNADKGVFVRSRMDAAHELGHLILHQSVSEKERNDKAKFKLLEKQAFRFGSAFLMPEQSFLKDLWTPSLDAFRDLKERWGAAISAMIMRSKDLGIVDADQASRLWMNLGRRGWRREEPLDSFLAPEKPALLRQSIETVVDNGVRSKTGILNDLSIPAADCEALCGLDDDYFGAGSASLNIELKDQSTNIVSFPG